MADPAPAATATLSNIQHFVVLMLENRSFDRTFRTSRTPIPGNYTEESFLRRVGAGVSSSSEVIY